MIRKIIWYIKREFLINRLIEINHRTIPSAGAIKLAQEYRELLERIAPMPHPFPWLYPNKTDFIENTARLAYPDQQPTFLIGNIKYETIGCAWPNMYKPVLYKSFEKL